MATCHNWSNHSHSTPQSGAALQLDFSHHLYHHRQANRGAWHDATEGAYHDERERANERILIRLPPLSLHLTINNQLLEPKNNSVFSLGTMKNINGTKPKYKAWSLEQARKLYSMQLACLNNQPTKQPQGISKLSNSVVVVSLFSALSFSCCFFIRYD